MKFLTTIIILIILTIQAFGQDKASFFLDEFTLSANRTNLKDSNTEDRYGFGLGAYHSFFPGKKINLIFGLEYNRTSQFKKDMYEGHFANATGLTYHINCLSVPLGIRINIGNKIKFFIETGGYADLIVYSNRKGTLHTFSVDENNLLVDEESQINEKANLSNAFGAYLGVGVRIPISKYELIIKPDYKFGINALYSYQDQIFNRYLRLAIGLKIN